MNLDFFLVKMDRLLSLFLLLILEYEYGFASSWQKFSKPRGFVSVDRKAGAVKLVDRLEFSRANFTIAKDWVKG